MAQPILTRIRIFPLKAFDPVSLDHAEVGLHALRYDREFALLTHDGHFINGKRTGRVNELNASFDLNSYLIHLKPRAGGQTNSFHLLNEKIALEKYLTSFFNEPVSLVHNTSGQLMDIPNISSVTIASLASLQSLQTDLSDNSLDLLRLRFRITLELDGTDAYWEENLIDRPGSGVRFKVGDVEMIGISPRARCNVPPRDPFTGIPDKTFIKKMMKSRAQSLPPNSPLPLFGSLYQFTINAHLPESEQGKWLHIGDKVTILEKVDVSHTEE